MKNKIRTYGMLFILSCSMFSCTKQSTLTVSESDYFRKEGDIGIMSINIGAQQHNSLGSYLNVLTGDLYTKTLAEAGTQNVDMIYYYSTVSGINFFAPDAEDIDDIYPGHHVKNGWKTKNTGYFTKLPNATAEDKLDFEKIATSKELTDFYDEIIARATAENEAPVSRLKNIEPGNIIAFRSEDRNIKSIIVVESATQGKTGAVLVSIKTDGTNKIILPAAEKPSEVADPEVMYIEASSRRGNATDGTFIDLLAQKTYKEADAALVPETIDIVNLNGSSSAQNIMSISSRSGLAAFATALANRIDLWQVINETLFFKQTGTTANQNAYNNLGISKDDLEGAFESLATSASPVIRTYPVETGDILYLKSVTRNFYAAIKVQESDAANAILKMELKIYKEQ